MTKKPAAVMMRIAIAGGGGLASLIAQELCQSAHAVLVLSRMPHPEFESNYGCQVVVVDYHNMDSLQFAVQGIDLVISTITGAEQLNLIEAAKRVRVRCFVPSEFEGTLSHRPPNGHDPFDTESSAALAQLRHWASSRHHSMKYTVFSCGVFYERFAPGGLGAYNMGTMTRLRNEGDYMINVRNGTAEVPASNMQGRSFKISMTSAFDVARFVAAAVELGIDNWPREFKMRGTKLSPQKIQQYCSEVRQMQFEVQERPVSEISDWADYYQQNQDEDRWFFMQHLLQTAMGRYTFDETNLNELVNFEPMAFKDWLYTKWGPAQ
ncbi:isoflavone reductase [Xylariaceae sp. FL1019]|nr:isoflavone reductase [Xylariaceae sp. FL1019]